MEKTLKNVAVSKLLKNKQEYYLAGKKNYKNYRNVLRVRSLGEIDGWYSFIYTRNGSKHCLKETVRIDLTYGLEITSPQGK